MRVKDFELEILVNEKPVTEYSHKGMTFLEGRRGSQFTLRFHNRTGKRVLVVPSIDGVNTLNGQQATVDSPGFAVNGHKSIIIKGWTVNNETGAAFVFFDKEENTQKIYAQSVSGSVKNAGVIGVLIFAEKEEPKVEIKTVHHHHIHVDPYPPYIAPYWQRQRDIMWLGSPTSIVNNTTDNSYNAAIERMTSTSNSMVNESVHPGMPAGDWSTTANTTQRMAASNMHKAKASNMHVQATSVQNQGFDMGTGWGQKVDFKINQIEFNKGDLVANIQVFYESRRSLERRGIEIRRQRVTAVEELPQAFAGIGCKPPAGWNG